MVYYKYNICLGHSVYQGFLYMEATYNNPVMNAFVLLLVNHEEAAKQSEQNHLVFTLKNKGILMHCMAH